MRSRFVPRTTRLAALSLALLMLPSVAFAQSPWERAASNLATTFTGPLARSLALVAIVIGGLMFMFGEGAPSGRSAASSSAADWRCSRRSSSPGCSERPSSSRRSGHARPPDVPARLQALHRPLTVCGVDRRLFFLALLVGAATFNLFYWFLAGCCCSSASTRSPVGHPARSADAADSAARRQERAAATTPASTHPIDVEVTSW